MPFHIFFSHIIEIKPIVIQFLNRASISIFYSSLMYFIMNFYLTSVLYIPKFHTNLITIHKITSFLRCNVYLNFSHCLIQRNHTLKTIGITKLRNGLYLLQPPLNTRVVITDNYNPPTYNNIIHNCKLWHILLKHPF